MPSVQRRRQRAMELLKVGDAAGAEKEVRRLLKRAPKDLELREFLGLVLLRRNRHEDGIKLIRGAIADGLEQPATYKNLSLALAAAGRPLDAIAAARRAVELAPSSADMQLNLGNWHITVRQVAEAKAAYERALELNPGLVAAITSLGNLHTALGEREAAVGYYRKALAAQPGNVAAFYHLTLSEQSGQAAIGSETIRRFQRIAELGHLTPNDAAMLHNALGRLAEREGQFAVAFDQFDRANGLSKLVNQQTGGPHDRAAHSRQIDHLIEAFPATLFETRAPGASDSRRPILIVGMPRSGTTVIDQVLANHSQIAAGGERLELPVMPEQIPKYPGQPGRWSESFVRGLAERYLADLARVDPSAPFVTDKYPINFLHLGLLARLVPGARVVHCRRDPLDSCLSCFTQNFARGNSFSHDLADLGAFYRDYVRLMAHWRRVLPIKLVELDYEALTHQPEPNLRRLLAELELPWEPKCLALETAKNPVFTASVWQVRQPINARAVGRWRNFQAQLGPLIAALGDLAPEHPSADPARSNLLT